MIYVECKPDTTMTKSLCGAGVTHVAGKSRVCRKLMEQMDCVGMADEDKESQKHPYLVELNKTGSINEIRDSELIVYEDEKRNNRLILLRPRLEEWIISTTASAGIEMSSYNLPDDAEELHLVLSIGSREKLNQFRMLVQKLANSSNRMQTLIKLLR